MDKRILGLTCVTSFLGAVGSLPSAAQLRRLYMGLCQVYIEMMNHLKYLIGGK